MVGNQAGSGWEDLQAENDALRLRIARLEQVVLAQAEAQAEQRDHSAERLRQTEQRYEELVRICPFGIMLHYDNHIVFINARGAQTLGADNPAQILGREPMEFLHPDSEAMFWERNEQLRRDGRAPLAEFALKQLDGSPVQVEAASVVFYISGKRAIQTVFQDITARLGRAVGEVQAPASAAPQSHGMVLVIDDEPIVTMVAEGILRRAGYDVVCAANGIEGLAHAATYQGRLRAVLLDLTMPEMDGVESFARLQQLAPDLPVILCSGYAEPDAMARFGTARPAGMLQKPFDSAELLAKLQEVLPARPQLRIVNG